jgi:hypothetical protein
MKRNIKVKEQNLIDRLNDRVKAGDKANAEAILQDAKEKYGPAEYTGRGTETEVVKEDTRLRTPYEEPKSTINVDLPFEPEKYEEVNHPQHYNNYEVEVIDMMERVFGREATASFCLLNAFKYRMRAGTKPGQSVTKDLDKEQWYLKKYGELTDK